ncbi:hypothetical protein ACN27F_31010 [Solwaraspora sp. WMMB335]|uniref:hypothetical protein n=1 Tax=Solwaraspora sp. WMMB335 TaxID=3404118 RepID=UPI003B9631D5
MSRRDARRRSRRWTKRSERAIPYGPFARLTDWWCATRDARKGIPQLPPEDARAGSTPADTEPHLNTPRMMFLGQLGAGRWEKEWIVYQAEVADLTAGRRNAEAQRDAFVEQLAPARDRLRQADQPPDTTVRLAGEQHTDAAIVAQRRRREQADRRERVAAEVGRLVEALHATQTRIAYLDEQIAIRLRVTQRRAAMIEAYVRRREAAYLTRLVRRHPQGARLNTLLRPTWPQPPRWLRADHQPATTAPPADAPAWHTRAAVS